MREKTEKGKKNIEKVERERGREGGGGDSKSMTNISSRLKVAVVVGVEVVVKEQFVVE